MCNIYTCYNELPVPNSGSIIWFDYELAPLLVEKS